MFTKRLPEVVAGFVCVALVFHTAAVSCMTAGADGYQSATNHTRGRKLQGWCNPALSCGAACCNSNQLCHPSIKSCRMARRPILNGWWSPDPFITYYNGWYYLLVTAAFHVEIHRSRSPNFCCIGCGDPGCDTASLDQFSNTIIYRPPPDKGKVWAPELHMYNKKWYIYFSMARVKYGSFDKEEGSNTQRMYVIASRMPAGSDPMPTGPWKPDMTANWKFLGQLNLPGNTYATDGTIWQQPGTSNPTKKYFVWSGYPTNATDWQRLYIARIKDATRISAGRTEISAPEYAWERSEMLPHVPGYWMGINEGPAALTTDTGRSFIFFSAGGDWSPTGCIGRLEYVGPDPLKRSSWRKNPQPVMSPNAASKAWQVGHNSFFRREGTGQWHIAFHAKSEPTWGTEARRARVQYIDTDSNGYPHLAAPAPLSSKALPAAAANAAGTPEPQHASNAAFSKQQYVEFARARIAAGDDGRGALAGPPPLEEAEAP